MTDKNVLQKLRETEEYRPWVVVDRDIGDRLSASGIIVSNGNNHWPKYRLTAFGEWYADKELGLDSRETRLDCLLCDQWFRNTDLKVCGECFGYFCEDCFDNHVCN